MKVVNRFILGIQFLTRIPLTSRAVPCEREDFSGAMFYFTTIGAIIGGIQYLVFWLMNQLVPGDFAAFLAVITGVIVTGGIHLDGLSDIFDGFGANANRERTMEIMKDSRVGAFGVLAIVLDLLFHLVAFQALKEQPMNVILVPVFAKMGVVLLCFIGKNAKQGLGALWIENIGILGLLFNAVIAFVLGVLICGILKTLVIGVAICIATYSLKNTYTKKLGGVTGDCLGATNQLLEWLILILLIIGV